MPLTVEPLTRRQHGATEAGWEIDAESKIDPKSSPRPPGNLATSQPRPKTDPEVDAASQKRLKIDP